MPRIWIALFLGVMAMAPGHAFAQANPRCRAQYLEQILQGGQVPNLTRCRPDDVRKSLNAYNYGLEIESRIPNNIPAGRIVSQQEGDGTVYVVVSTGPAYQQNHGDGPYEQPHNQGGGGLIPGILGEIAKEVVVAAITPKAQQPPYQQPPYQQPPYQQPPPGYPEPAQPPVQPNYTPPPQVNQPPAAPPVPPAPEPAPPPQVAQAAPPPAAPVTPVPKPTPPTPKPPKQLAQATKPAPTPKPAVVDTPKDITPAVDQQPRPPVDNPPVAAPEPTPPPQPVISTPPVPPTRFFIEGKPRVENGKQFAFTIRRENGDGAGHVLQLDYSDPSLLVAPPSQFTFGPNLQDQVALRLQAATRARGAGDRELKVTVTSGDRAEIAQPTVTAVILGRPSWWDLIRAALSSPAALIAAAAAAAVAGTASLYLLPRAKCSLGTPSVDLGPIPLRNDWPSLHVDTILGSASFSIPTPLPIGRRTDAHQPVSA